MTSNPEELISLEESLQRLREAVKPLEDRGIVPPVGAPEDPIHVAAINRVERHAHVVAATHSTAPKRAERIRYAHNEEL